MQRPDFTYIGIVVDPRPGVNYAPRFDAEGHTTLRRHHPNGCQGFPGTPTAAGWATRLGTDAELAERPIPCGSCLRMKRIP